MIAPILQSLGLGGPPLTPEQRAIQKEWLLKHDDRVARANFVVAFPAFVALYFGFRQSELESFVKVGHAFCLIGLMTLSLWGILQKLVRIERWIKLKHVACLLHICVVTLMAYYTNQAHYVNSQQVTVFSQVVEGQQTIMVAESRTVYDVVRSSTYMLIASILCIFIIPAHGWKILAMVGVYYGLGVYAYFAHDDRSSWLTYLAAGTIGGAIFNYRLLRQTKQTALLELRNRELVAREATAKFEHEMELAKEIQTSLAPPPVLDFGGTMRIHTYQIPHYTVGGDWLAVRESADGKLVLLVGDATGKGMQAALVVHALQALWAKHLDEPVFDPQQFLNQANRTLLQLGMKKAHTMTLGILMVEPYKLTYWSAGHCPVQVLDDKAAQKRQQVRQLVAHGGVLGLADNLDLVSKELALPKGERRDILLGSDGIFEALPRKRSILLTLVAYLRSYDRRAVEMVKAEDDKTLIWIEYQDEAAALKEAV